MVGDHHKRDEPVLEQQKGLAVAELLILMCLKTSVAIKEGSRK